MDRGPDRWQIYRLALVEAGRAIRMGAARVESRVRAPFRPAPKGLIIAPHDLRTSDPTVASDIYSGYFVFAGRALATGGRPPFAHVSPSRAWGEALYGFGWLRDLRAADTALARANARALVDDFIGGCGDKRLARETSVLSRRLISFLSQSPLILDGADHPFYARFLRAVGRAARDLEADLRGGTLPYPRLQAAIALGFAGLCCEGFDRLQRRASRALARELDRQILPDGGHRSRNPRVLVELLLDLLPLRQAYASRGLEAPDALVRAIDRILPHLRLLRAGHSTLSHFNGMGTTAADQLATLMMYEGAPGQAMRRAPQTGYERLTAGMSTLVADVGPAPPLLHSAEAHAGCLSFEFWRDAQPIIVNCGAPPPATPARQPARATAAHSTASIDGQSSCRFLSVKDGGPDRWLQAWLLRRIGPVVVEGPQAVPVERGESGGALTLTASHDGYARIGVRHERRWRLGATGERLEGEDVFARIGDAGTEPRTATLRFHLAPGISAGPPDGSALTLTLQNGEAWRFEAGPGGEIEESTFFALSGGARRTRQIVVQVPLQAQEPVRWSFERLTATKR